MNRSRNTSGVVAAVAVAGFAVAGYVFWKKVIKSQEDGIRVAIIGTGWGVRVQVPQFRAAGLHIFGVYSRDQKRASQIAAENGITHAFSNLTSLLSVETIDLVSIVTPVYLHAQQTLEAIEAGKNVLCDKPLCLNADEAEAMLEAHKRHSGKLVIVDHELRFTPAFLKAREHLRRGTIGTVLAVEANVMFPMQPKAFSWWNDARKGGGALGAVGSHVIDALRFLLDAEVESVSANLRTLVKELPDEEGKPILATADDYACLRFQLVPRLVSGQPGPGPSWAAAPDGIVSAHATLVTRGQARIENRMIFSGSEGAVIVSTSKGGLSVTDASGAVIDQVKPSGNPFATTGTRALGAALQKALGPDQDRSALEPAATLEDGVACQYVIDAALASSKNDGKWIRAWNNNLEIDDS